MPTTVPYKKQGRIIYVMGVSGSGKSTVGKLLAEKLNIPFFDGDDFHPEKNKAKMKSGIPLNDEDRSGWLYKLNALACKMALEKGCVIACSALKSDYRKLLKKTIENNVNWVYLKGSFECINERMKLRKGHFMPSELLQSQFDTLEEPNDAIQVAIEKKPDEIIIQIMDELEKSEFGLIGLGVMGKSLCRNLASHGFSIAMYNRHVKDKEEDVAKKFKAEHEVLENAKAFDNLKAFTASLQQPRKIMLMVNAGPAIDLVINELLPHLDKGDIIIDGGNSHYLDTARRVDRLKESDIHFIGAGVSGGEEGALRGPSIMPGGDSNAYDMIKPYLETIAAKNKNGNSCCKYIGEAGSGHFVKMVHNGIEYVEMQLLAEIYHSLRYGFHKNPDEIAEIFESWAGTSLNNYLLEITIQILREKEDDDWLIDKILDKAGNKGTGNWTTVAGAQIGIPINMLTDALYSRYISSFKSERAENSNSYQIEKGVPNLTNDDLKAMYTFSRIINHHQGLHLIQEASDKYEWNLNLSTICEIWTNGCIIKSELMEDLITILDNTTSVLTHEKIVAKLRELHPVVTKAVANLILNRIPVSSASSALNYFNQFTEYRSSANIIQAQRDFFGAHTYERIDGEEGVFYHTQWNNKN